MIEKIQPYCFGDLFDVITWIGLERSAGCEQQQGALLPCLRYFLDAAPFFLNYFAFGNFCWGFVAYSNVKVAFGWFRCCLFWFCYMLLAPSL